MHNAQCTIFDEMNSKTMETIQETLQAIRIHQQSCHWWTQSNRIIIINCKFEISNVGGFGRHDERFASVMEQRAGGEENDLVFFGNKNMEFLLLSEDGKW